MESIMTSQACTMIPQLLNVTIPDCQDKAEKLWNMAANLCPKATEAAPSPGDMEKEICKTLGNKFMESIMTSQACTMIPQLLNVTIPDCQDKAEKLWNMAASLCPKATETAPSPGDIEKEICK